MSWYVPIHRKIIDWERYTDVPTKTLFIHLLLRANHSVGKWKWITINPWQLITWRKELSKHTGLSEQQIRTSIKKLKSTSEITSTSTSKFSLITLCNWDTYRVNKKNQPAHQPTHQPASNQQATTNNNNIEEKENKRKKKSVVIIPRNKEQSIKKIHEIQNWLQFSKAEQKTILVFFMCWYNPKEKETLQDVHDRLRKLAHNGIWNPNGTPRASLTSVLEYYLEWLKETDKEVRNLKTSINSAVVKPWRATNKVLWR